jgi:hypothetical protein
MCLAQPLHFVLVWFLARHVDRLEFFTNVHKLLMRVRLGFEGRD